jgi:restriction system protein
LAVLVFYFAGLNDKAKKQQQHRRLAAQAKHIDKMSGSEFEHHLAEYFARRGYKIELTPASGDYGADLVLRSRTECIVVQAKRWNSKIGVSAVQEISTARHFYGASSALLITNSSLTKSANKLANRANVNVWERTKLFEKLAES